MRPWILLVLLFGAVSAIRMSGASDLYKNEDQTRSIGFTADVALNGRWILPRDFAGELARKPPLINWIGAVLPRLGFWDEWALKFPSLLGGVLAVGFCFGAAKRIAESNVQIIENTSWFASATAAVFLGCPEMVKHIYFLRPDMLNTAWLAGAWFFSLKMWDSDRRKARLNALGFWMCTGLAALTKGTTALIPILYLPLATKVATGRWRNISQTGWWWGLPLAVGLFAIWGIPLVTQHEAFVRQVLIGEETLSRMGSEPFWFWKALATSWQILYWFCERFLPWSCFSVAALVVIRPGMWFRGALKMAILWVLVTLAFFIPVEHRGGSYFMPAYPAAAVLAVWFLSSGIGKWRLKLPKVFALAAGVALAFAIYKGFWSDDARRGVGDAIKEFAKASRARVGRDTLVFANAHTNPVIALMGRHQAGDATKEQWQTARWSIFSVPEDTMESFRVQHKPVLVSRRLERKVDKGRGQYLCLVENER